MALPAFPPSRNAWASPARILAMSVRHCLALGRGLDMQRGFCGPGGYVDQVGYDISLNRAPIQSIRRVLKVGTAVATEGHAQHRASCITTYLCVPHHRARGQRLRAGSAAAIKMITM